MTVLTVGVKVNSNENAIYPSILLSLCSSFDCFLSEVALPHLFVRWFGCRCGVRGASRGTIRFCMHRGQHCLISPQKCHISIIVIFFWLFSIRISSATSFGALVWVSVRCKGHEQGYNLFLHAQGPMLSNQPPKSAISISPSLCYSFDCFLLESALSCPFVCWFGCQWDARGTSGGTIRFCMHRGQCCLFSSPKVPYLHQYSSVCAILLTIFLSESALLRPFVCWFGCQCGARGASGGTIRFCMHRGQRCIFSSPKVPYLHQYSFFCAIRLTIFLSESALLHPFVCWFGCQCGARGASGGSIHFCMHRGQCCLLTPPKSATSPSIFIHLYSSFDCFLSESTLPHASMDLFWCQCGERGKSRE